MSARAPVERRAPSRMSARAQSMVSVIDGAFRRSSARTAWTKRDERVARAPRDAGHAQLEDGELARRRRVVEEGVKAAPAKRVGHVARRVAW